MLVDLCHRVTSLDRPGNKESQLRNWLPHIVWKAFYCLLIEVGGPSPLWVLSPWASGTGLCKKAIKTSQ